MAKRTKLIVIVDGIENSRESSTRSYTHVVVGRLDVAGMLAKALSKTPGKDDREDFEFWLDMSSRQPGVEYTRTYKDNLGRARSYQNTETAERIEEAKAKVVGGFDGFWGRRMAKSVGAAQERFDAAQAAGFPRTVLQWSMSEANAQKGAGQWRGGRYGQYVDVSVLAVADILKPVAIAA